MKETFPEPVSLFPPGRIVPSGCDSSLPTGGNAFGAARAAAIGLFLSMGTTGFLAFRPEPVHAAISPSSERERSLSPNGGGEESAPDSPRVAEGKSFVGVSGIATSAIEHEIQPGESLWLLARAYQTTPEAIASINQISLLSELKIGRTLKIPTPERLRTEPPSEISTSEQLEPVLDSWQLTRERLQESLMALRARDVPSGSTPVSGENTPEHSVVAIENGNAELGIEIPVPAPAEATAEGSGAIPIAVPTPESDRPLTATLPSRTRNATLLEKRLPSDGSEREPGNGWESPAIAVPRVIVPPRTRYYRVRRGDTLNTIARGLGISPGELARANGINNPNRIEVDRALVVPERVARRAGTGGAFGANLPAGEPLPISFRPDRGEVSNPGGSDGGEIKRKESLAAAYAERLREDVAQLRRSIPAGEQKVVRIPVEFSATEPDDRPDGKPGRTGVASRFPRPTGETVIGSAPTNVEEYNDRLRIPVGETVEPSLPPLSDPEEHLPDIPFAGYIWPTRGVLTSGFGWRWGRPHRGIDIAGPSGTPVVAAASGEVISAGWNSGGYGNLVKLRHADGSVTFYAHNSRLLVRRGQLVEQGQPIAAMGSTGFSTGPHLHFEVHPEGKGAVNPIAFLPGR